jgi:hypothetical protein
LCFIQGVQGIRGIGSRRVPQLRRPWMAAFVLAKLQRQCIDAFMLL